MRKLTTVRLPKYMLTDLNSEARRQDISVSKLIENITEAYMYQQPNPDTLAALEEARSGVEMEELTDKDLEDFEANVANL